MNQPSLYTIKAILILDNDGGRLVGKYFDQSQFASIKEQRDFEKTLFTKTSKANGEIVMIDNLTIVNHYYFTIRFARLSK